jgi:hypothetical protein
MCRKFFRTAAFKQFEGRLRFGLRLLTCWYSNGDLEHEAIIHWACIGLFLVPTITL